MTARAEAAAREFLDGRVRERPEMTDAAWYVARLPAMDEWAAAEREGRMVRVPVQVITPVRGFTGCAYGGLVFSVRHVEAWPSLHAAIGRAMAQQEVAA